MFGNGAPIVGMKTTKVRPTMAAFGMPLMIPDLKSYAAALGAAIRGAVVLLTVTATHPATVAGALDFVWFLPSQTPGLFSTTLYF